MEMKIFREEDCEKLKKKVSLKIYFLFQNGCCIALNIPFQKFAEHIKKSKKSCLKISESVLNFFCSF